MAADIFSNTSSRVGVAIVHSSGPSEAMCANTPAAL